MTSSYVRVPRIELHYPFVYIGGLWLALSRGTPRHLVLRHSPPHVLVPAQDLALLLRVRGQALKEARVLEALGPDALVHAHGVRLGEGEVVERRVLPNRSQSARVVSPCILQSENSEKNRAVRGDGN